MPYVASNEHLEVVDAAALVRDLELCELLCGLVHHGFREAAQLDVRLAGRTIVASYVLRADGIQRSLTIPILTARSREIALIDAFACLEVELAAQTGKRPGATLALPREAAPVAQGNVVPFPVTPRPAAEVSHRSVAMGERIATTSDRMNANLQQVATLLEELAAAGTVAPQLLVEVTERVQELNEAAARFARTASESTSRF